ncbi:SDR family oxidoreductase [Pseudoxanthomonas sp. SL93]|jgi:NAD(P)-dependent dehydrogenase (short-subunit alcohol dehydrogenase family)|uniref:SDR family oxidoreductase n=1 Tax=Pseudoxanthomonas sp. SL93 TaxID=2995142 RepID=UPI00226FCEEC|nr:SDR family oxidoreductase [Pseudoxanthomonas sp. SL93]WAC62581.1 SDR family oxidoreductase [Pseudoxanthomonas sp. SL93]
MDRKHCLVTGANRGLGLEFTRQLLARRCHVVATCRQPGKAVALNLLAGEYPGRLHVLPLDVTDARSRAELARELPLVTDDEPLHLLVNNAGVLRGGERFGQISPADLDASFHTNAAGPFLLVQALAAQLADGGTVANLSSEIGSIALRQEFRTPSYAIGKAAQNMATSLLSQALAPRGIKVVALHPGWVQTDMGGANAAVTVQDSVTGLLQVIDHLRAEDSGVFLDWLGQPLPW